MKSKNKVKNSGPGPRLGLAVSALLALLSACGGANKDDNAHGATGIMKMIVHNARSFDPNISHGKIQRYKVTITGEGINEPIEAVFDGDASGGIIDNVPSGENRSVSIEAINPNSVIIRAGEASGIAISPGELTEVRVDMASVPIFANLSDGNIVPNTLFIARVFSEPDSPVVVEDASGGAATALSDLASGGSEVLPDASTFFAVIRPPLLAPGWHKFTVKNKKNGRASTVEVYLADGTVLKAAPLYGGGAVRPFAALTLVPSL